MALHTRARDSKSVSESDEIAERRYARVYRTSGKADIHEFLVQAVEAAGARVLYVSQHTRAPVFIGLEISDNQERMGLLCYPFRATRNVIHNRPADEHRLQIRYGAEEAWEEDHPLGFDLAGVDTTLVLGVHIEGRVFVGLDPRLYDPLPMGISVEFKEAEVVKVRSEGWHPWQRVNRSGARRTTARSLSGVETLIGFSPENLIRYVRLEREAQALGLDPVLRMRAAEASPRSTGASGARHVLEHIFHLTSQELLEIIATRKRLAVAVRGGVAEHHLIGALAESADVRSVMPLDADGPPDAEVVLHDGGTIRVECKNGEEARYANGDGRVEVQKTRSSKGDPASRYYEPGQFDVLAVCLWPPHGSPRFVYRATADLARHPDFPERLAVLHRIDETWATSLAAALNTTSSNTVRD